MRFKALRRHRRQPSAPMFLPELDLPFDEVMSDLVFPWGEAGAVVPATSAPLNRAV